MRPNEVLSVSKSMRYASEKNCPSGSLLALSATSFSFVDDLLDVMASYRFLSRVHNNTCRLCWAGPGVTPFPVVIAHTRHSETHRPSALAPVPLAAAYRGGAISCFSAGSGLATPASNPGSIWCFSIRDPSPGLPTERMGPPRLLGHPLHPCRSSKFRQPRHLLVP